MEALGTPLKRDGVAVAGHLGKGRVMRWPLRRLRRCFANSVALHSAERTLQSPGSGVAAAGHKGTVMTVLLWIVLGGVAMSAIALVGSVTLMLRASTLQKVLLSLVAFAAGAMMGGALVHMLGYATHSV